MTWWARRRGFFEGPPRALYLRTGTRYFDACAWVIVLNGLAVSGFGVIALVLYVDLSPGDVALFAACLAVGYVLEGALASRYLLRSVKPAHAWLGGERADEGAAAAARATPKSVCGRGGRRGGVRRSGGRAAQPSPLPGRAAVPNVLPALHL